jgi:hypothetical protein
MDWLLREGDTGGVMRARHDGDGESGAEGREEGVQCEGRGGSVSACVVPVFFSVLGFFDGGEGVCWFGLCKGVSC